jgi:hypothetical protein
MPLIILVSFLTSSYAWIHDQIEFLPMIVQVFSWFKSHQINTLRSYAVQEKKKGVFWRATPAKTPPPPSNCVSPNTNKSDYSFYNRTKHDDIDLGQANPGRYHLAALCVGRILHYPKQHEGK